MAHYYYVNVKYDGQHSIHYGTIKMREVLKFDHSNRIRDILEERYPDKIIAVDIVDDSVLIIGPSNLEKWQIAASFLLSVDPYSFRTEWQAGSI
ncbi:hypothetical protein IC235_05855 [Hymenobacter sp. BT664]|uniref:Uncharacterized protein n=1 Tax=Hymenobacter montanus TaxID=2771359 RepID=A0A927GIH5_9BACT|nr:hypothetical protein [Hymenobacter montanus]MBD2767412.1 hypothetical protein [Hymenobacter montanus]